MASMPRLASLLAVTVLLSGCSARVQNMVDTAKLAVMGYPDVELTTAEVNEYPYAAAYLKTDNFPQAIAVLDRVSGEQRLYRTGGEEAVTTRFGRVLSSAGIPGMPLYTLNWQADPLPCHVQQQHRGTKQLCPEQWQRTVEVGNYGANDLQQLELDSTFDIAGTQSYLHPDGTQLEVTVITEQGDGNGTDFKNTFYAANGRVVYAHQWLSPEIGYATWREMKPYSGDLPPVVEVQE